VWKVLSGLLILPENLPANMRGDWMSGFICGADRSQGSMFPAQLEDYVAGDNPVRVIDFFVDQLDFRELGFSAVDPKETGWPSYHPAVMLKIYVYGYINRVQSSRRLERECQRNVEVMWLTGCLAPDFKTIADFRKDNGAAIRKVCREFIVVCGRAGVLTATAVAIDGSKFKAVNSRDRNFTEAKVATRVGGQTVHLGFVTGTLYSMSEHAALAVARSPVPHTLGPWDTHRWRAARLAWIWTAFFFGALLGTTATSFLEAWTPILPAIILFAIALRRSGQ
jgi:transposase